MKYGVQLYNFRNELANDFKGTLERVAEIGFDGVEFACNYGGIDPEELTGFLKSINLECVGTMFTPAQLFESDPIAWAYQKALNSPAVTISYNTDFVNELDKTCEFFSTIAANAKANGTVFSYHNHWWEFIDVNGVAAMERILDAENCKDVYMEADVCWLTRAGYNPADFIRKYKSRIRQLHLKDIVVADDVKTTTELGKGIVKLQEAFDAAKAAGVEYFIYEQDTTVDPFESARQSLEFMRKL